MGEAAVKPLDSSGLRGASKEAWQDQTRLREILLTKTDLSPSDKGHTAKKEVSHSDKSGRTRK